MRRGQVDDGPVVGAPTLGFSHQIAPQPNYAAPRHRRQGRPVLRGPTTAMPRSRSGARASDSNRLSVVGAEEAELHQHGMRLACGYDRRPLEWRRSRGPADKFRYHVEIR